MSKEAEANSQQWQELVYSEALRLAKYGYRVFPLRRMLKASISGNLCHHSASTNEKTITKWFQPGVGSYAGHNLGLATGGNTGVLVIDLDKIEDKDKGDIIDGFKTLALLEEESGNKLPRVMVSNTPRGGNHLFFKWSKDIPHGQKVLGPGIDVRSGGHNYSSGHVVVYPSVINGNTYSWGAGPVQIDELPEVPKWLKAHSRAPLGDRPEWLGDTGEGNEKVDPMDVLSPIPKQDVLLMLNVIPPDQVDYDTWIKVGRAIHSQWPDSEGLQMWDTWSKQDASRYKNNDCSLRWDGFAGGFVSIGSLVWVAQQHGWVSSKADEIKVALERINKETPGVLVSGNERWILADNALASVSLLSKSAATLYHDLYRVDISGDDDTPKKVNPLTLWKTWPGRLLYHGLAMFPPPCPVPPRMYNLWRGFQVHPKQGNVDPWLEFMASLIPNESDRDWVNDWVAQMYQKPGEKPLTSLVLKGQEGVGKNTFTDVLGSLFYRNNWVQFEDTEQALSNFNSQMISAVLLVMNEVLWSGNHRHANKIKGMITEPNLVIEMKGVDKFMAPNCSHVVIMTNDDWAVPAGAQSRRFMVVDVPSSLKGNTQYWGKLRAWTKSEEAKQAILHWYLNRKITSDLHEAPVNNALHHQRVVTAIKGSNGLTAADVVVEMLTANKALRHDGKGQWQGAWYWSTAMIRETWYEVAGKHPNHFAAARVREFLALLLGVHAERVMVWDNHKNILVYGVPLPDNPSVLLDALVTAKVISEYDVPRHDNWEESQRREW